MRSPNSPSALHGGLRLGFLILVLAPLVVASGCSSGASDRARRKGNDESAPRVTANDLPEAVMPGSAASARNLVYASPSAGSGTSPPASPPPPTPAPPTFIPPMMGRAPVAQPPPVELPPAVARPMGPVATSPIVPAGPERTSDRGDRTLKTSPIGQLAPEEVPPVPTPAPATTR